MKQITSNPEFIRALAMAAHLKTIHNPVVKHEQEKLILAALRAGMRGVNHG